MAYSLIGIFIQLKCVWRVCKNMEKCYVIKLNWKKNQHVKSLRIVRQHNCAKICIEK